MSGDSLCDSEPGLPIFVTYQVVELYQMRNVLYIVFQLVHESEDIVGIMILNFMYSHVLNSGSLW